MDHFNQIYATQADAYHRMISAEDVDGNLLPAIQRAVSLSGKKVLDLGTGTGRMPLLCHGLDTAFVALDRQRAMLREQALQRDACGGRWPLVQGDLIHLPFSAGSFDLVTAGWSLGHTTEWHPEVWPERVTSVISEMQRVLRRPGALIIMETLGTGSLTAAPPAPNLAAYYEKLEQQWGFQRTVVPTDYQFASLDDAVLQMTFFFGEELGDRVRQNNWTRVPEWTGLWVRRYM